MLNKRSHTWRSVPTFIWRFRAGKANIWQWKHKQWELIRRRQRELCGLLDIALYFPSGTIVKNPPANAGDAASVPGWERSPRERNGNPLQLSCLKNPTDRGSWQAMVQRVGHSLTMSTRHILTLIGCLLHGYAGLSKCTKLYA